MFGENKKPYYRLRFNRPRPVVFVAAVIIIVACLAWAAHLANRPGEPQNTKPGPTNKTAPVSGAGSHGLFNTIPAYSYGGYNYAYVGGRQFASASGAAVSLPQARPTVAQTSNSNNHSLMELAVQSADQKQIVEVGWIVDQVRFRDKEPHLFVFHWADGQPGCYNGCGFVSSDQAATHVGDKVSPGQPGRYQIDYQSGAWVVWYNNQKIGYFPETLWGGKFTKLGLAQVFGEVETRQANGCVQMGNGLFGAAAGAAKFTDFALIGSKDPPDLYPYMTAGSTYNYGSVLSDGLSLGGPGDC